MGMSTTQRPHVMHVRRATPSSPNDNANALRRAGFHLVRPRSGIVMCIIGLTFDTGAVLCIVAQCIPQGLLRLTAAFVWIAT